MQNEPLVSVIMATFNEPREFIIESISSILNQTHRNLELLIADDSINSETIQVIDSFAERDNRVLVIRRPERMGFVNALNEALNVAKGEYIARMDGDDISNLDRFEIQLKYSKEHPEVDLFGGDIDIIDEHKNVISERRYPSTPSAIKKMFVFRSPYAHPTIMFKRKILDAGFRYDPEYKKDEDLDFFLRLYKKGYSFGNTSMKLLSYRVIGDLAQKRDRSQLIYNHKARARNFDWKKPVFSSLSWTVSLLYLIIPMKVFSYIYKRENSKKKL